MAACRAGAVTKMPGIKGENMNYENIQTEETVSISQLFALALRKWVWLVAAVLVGSLVFGLYRGVLRKGPTASEEQIKEMEDKIYTTETTLKTNGNDIASNERNIATNTGKIASHKQIIETNNNSLKIMEETLGGLRKTLAEAKALLGDSSLTPSERADLIEQISTAEADIIGTSSRIGETVRMIRTLEEETMTWTADIETYKERISMLKDARAKIEEQLAEQREDLEEMLTEPGIKSVVLTAAVGGILGAFAFCGIVLIQYIFTRKLRGAEDIKCRYGCCVLGEFYSEKAARHSGRLSREIDRLAGDRQTADSEDQVYELIAASVRARAGEAAHKIAVTGTVDEKTLRSVADKLSPLMEGDEIFAAPNPVYDPQLLTKIDESTVLLVERKNVSDRREIDKLAELLSACGARVVGAVIK